MPVPLSPLILKTDLSFKKNDKSYKSTNHEILRTYESITSVSQSFHYFKIYS